MEITTEQIKDLRDQTGVSVMQCKKALEEAKDKNVTQGNVLLTDTVDSLIYNYTSQLVVTIDLDDFLVVNTDDVLLVAKKSSVSKIKKLVQNLDGTKHEKLA